MQQKMYHSEKMSRKRNIPHQREGSQGFPVILVATSVTGGIKGHSDGLTDITQQLLYKLIRKIRIQKENMRPSIYLSILMAFGSRDTTT